MGDDLTTKLDPYCGPAPIPENVIWAWNGDVVLMAMIASGVGLLYVAQSPRQPGHIVLLSAVLIVAFISPLCALSTALFSARSVHHILVGTAAAPLIALMLPQLAKKASAVPPELVFLLHTAVYWAWHLPPGYSFALAGTPQYWLMQSAFTASSVWLWAILLSTNATVFTSMGLAVGTMVQMGFLGAILTFAPSPLFEAHFFTTQAFGMTPLFDQQLAGILMWTLGLLPFLAAALWSIHTHLSPSTRYQDNRR
ncbi:hypothetical protein ASF29_13775 [Rhizobium sp. Leaf262]|nr:hypothetical protein ASF29_13775 [Rhizobium sp. Leaf262]